MGLTSDKLKVKLPTIWTDEAAEVGRVRKEKGRRKIIREKKQSEERRSRCAKREKSRKTVLFKYMFCGTGGWKSRLLAKAAVRSHLVG